MLYFLGDLISLQVKSAEAEAEAKYLSGVGVAKQRKAIVDGLRTSIVVNDAVLDILFILLWCESANITLIIYIYIGLQRWCEGCLFERCDGLVAAYSIF